MITTWCNLHTYYLILKYSNVACHSLSLILSFVKHQHDFVYFQSGIIHYTLEFSKRLIFFKRKVFSSVISYWSFDFFFAPSFARLAQPVVIIHISHSFFFFFFRTIIRNETNQYWFDWCGNNIDRDIYEQFGETI